MKKLSKLAVILLAVAFVLSAFTGCPDASGTTNGTNGTTGTTDTAGTTGTTGTASDSTNGNSETADTTTPTAMATQLPKLVKTAKTYGGWWWLRSPHCRFGYRAYYIDYSGRSLSNDSVSYKNGGVVPALCLE